MTVILLGVVLTIVLVSLFVSLTASLRSLRLRKNYSAPKGLPSVSICIPARNEMHALTRCLERVLASNYPKLEVLVLDDASQDDTSIIIKSFAHAGVRFIPGKPLPEGWLGRNYAHEILAREASGTYVIFLDVDTFIQPNTVSQLIGYADTEKKAMVTVIPRRDDTHRANVLFGTLRYFWQLALWFRIPVSSSLWLVQREVLITMLDGFVSVKGRVEPEVDLAKRMGARYQPLLSTASLGVSYEKKWSSQLASSRRLLYPMFGKNFFGGFGGLLLMVTLNIPTILLLVGFISWDALQWLALIFVVLFGGMYALFLRSAWRSRWWLGVVLWPFATMQELVVYVMSVWGYSAKTITWKNRSIHTIPEKE